MDAGRLEWSVTNTKKRNIDLLLNERNVHPNDMAIQFDGPSHTYTVNGKRARISVTTFKKMFSFPFDEEARLKEMYAKTMEMPHAKEMEKAGLLHQLKIENPTSEYHGQVREEALGWNNKSGLGSEMHDRIDQFLSLRPDNPRDYSDSLEQLLEKIVREEDSHEERLVFRQFIMIMRIFYKDGWRPYRTEWRIWFQRAEEIIAGSIDAVLTRVGIDGVREYCVVDWKRTPRDLKSTFKKASLVMPFPLKAYPNCELSEYGLQVEVYRYILRKKYGLNVTCSFIVQLKPAKTERAQPHRHPIPDMQEDVEKCMDIYFRTQELKRAFNEWDRSAILSSKGNSWAVVPAQKHPLFFEDVDEYADAKVKRRKPSEDSEIAV